jgi:tyrosine-protein kinase Etk/Wzc
VLGAGDIFVPTGKVPEAGLEYLRRFREVKYQETMFEVLAKQYELARIDEAKDAAIIQVVDKAIESEKRTKPKRVVIVVLTALVAAIIAVLLAFLKEGIEKARLDSENNARFAQLRRYFPWR